MTDTILGASAPAATTVSTTTTSTTTTSLTKLNEWLAESEQDSSSSRVAFLRLSAEPSYVSLFTDQGANVSAHYLDRTESWAGGYVHCLGEGCPSCAAQIDRKRQLLLPVVDLTDAKVKVLRVPSEKGPGKLATELGKILALPNRAEMVAKITRGKAYQYVVELHSQKSPNPDALATINRFIENVNAGAIDLDALVTRLSAEEMAGHDRVAKRLALEGRAV